MAIEIIPVSPENVHEAIAVAKRVFQPYDHHALRQEFMAAAGLEPEGAEVRDEMEIHRSGYVVAMQDGKVAGFSGHYAQIGHDEDIWLGWTGVSPDFAGLGIGQAVIQAAFNSAQMDHVKKFRIWTSDEPQFASARKLYARMGFTEEQYDPLARPYQGGSLARVFTRFVDPSEKVTGSWAQDRYELPDLEIFDLPRLNRVAMQNVDFAKAKFA